MLTSITHGCSPGPVSLTFGRASWLQTPHALNLSCTYVGQMLTRFACFQLENPQALYLFMHTYVSVFSLWSHEHLVCMQSWLSYVHEQQTASCLYYNVCWRKNSLILYWDCRQFEVPKQVLVVGLYRPSLLI